MDELIIYAYISNTRIMFILILPQWPYFTLRSKGQLSFIAELSMK